MRYAKLCLSITNTFPYLNILYTLVLSQFNCLAIAVAPNLLNIIPKIPPFKSPYRHKSSSEVLYKPFCIPNMYLLTHCGVAMHGLHNRAHLNGKDGLYLSYAPPVDHAGVRQIRLMYKLMYKTCLLTQWWIKLSYWYCVYWNELGAGIRQWWLLSRTISHQIVCLTHWYIWIFF